MHPYYCKILLWFVINLLMSSVFNYIVIKDMNRVIVLTCGQSVLLLSFYPLFEYYYSWSRTTPCIDE